MLTHAKIVASAFSLLYLSLSPVPEGVLQRAEINSLARIKPGPSFFHVPPTPATVPMPTIKDVCPPCPDATAPQLKDPMFLLVDPGGEERLHPERHAHHLGSKEAILPERDEKKAENAAKKVSSSTVDSGDHQTSVKLEYETVCYTSAASLHVLIYRLLQAAPVPSVPPPLPRPHQSAEVSSVQVSQLLIQS